MARYTTTKNPLDGSLAEGGRIYTTAKFSFDGTLHSQWEQLYLVGSSRSAGTVLLHRRAAFIRSGSSQSAGSVLLRRRAVFAASAWSVSSGDVLIRRRADFVASGASTSYGDIVLVGFYRYITPLEVLSDMSASVREATPAAPDTASQVLRINGTAADRIYAFVDEDLPTDISADAKVLHADLRLYKAAAWPSGSQSITVSIISAVWDSATLTWSTAPAVGTSISVSVAGGGAARDLIDINVTSLIQEAIAQRDAGTPIYYGLRLTTTSTTDLTFYSAVSAPTLRPRLIAEHSVPPSAPSDPLPDGGRAVSETKPALDSRFRDADAGDVVSGGQWQVSTDDTFAVTTYDSGEIATTSALFDLADPPPGAPATPTLATATTYYWRVRLRDTHGLWSDYSPVADFKVVPKGTLVLTSPSSSSVSSPTPTFAVTYTPAGLETQESIEVEVDKFTDGIWQSHWLYPKTVSSLTSVTLPDSHALEEDVQYRVTWRLTDDVDREDMAGDRNFLEDSQEFTLTGISI